MATRARDEWEVVLFIHSQAEKYMGLRDLSSQNILVDHFPDRDRHIARKDRE